MSEICPRCGAETDELTELDDGRVECEDCSDAVLLEGRRIRRVLDKSSREAATHGANYAAGMRLSRSIIESELLSELSEAQDRQ